MKSLLLVCLFLFSISAGAAHQIKSPNQKIVVEINLEKEISWNASYEGEPIINNARLGLELKGKDILSKPKIRDSYGGLVLQEYKEVISTKYKTGTAQFTEYQLMLKKDVTLIFRVYNDGIAYRINTMYAKDQEITDELVSFETTPEASVLFPEENSFMSHFERTYLDKKVSDVSDSMFCSLPMLVTSNDIRIGVTEAAVVGYPHMFLKGDGAKGFKAIFPKVPKEILDRGDRNEKIINTSNYIARITPQQKLPWRVFMIAKEDKQLVSNNILASLNPPSVIQTDWIKPGKVAWDWWNANNIYGVDFKAGLNTDTYKYYIDFASEYGLEYIILDEGWSKSTISLFEPIEEIKLQELISYGEQKGVKLILWVLWKPLLKDLDRLTTLYASWGVAGIKVDFMQRADQTMVEYYEDIAKAAAEHKLMVDFHGAFKPSGLESMYPNIVNYEGVKGAENDKWSKLITPDHNLTLPFTRMLAGMMDYTPGGMRNVQAKNFSVSFERPMTMGTRCHQAAMYVIYESPLQMFADSPSNYKQDPKYTTFISRIPTTWDDLKVLEGKVSDYLVLAREKDGIWYLAGMTDWTEREFELQLSFLDTHTNYAIELLKDGANANRFAEDYHLSNSQIKGGSALKVKMAKGGGFVAILRPLN